MEQEEKLIVFNKYGNPVDANIVKGALEAAGIPAGVIGDSFANNLWKDAIRVVVFRRDLEEAIKVLYGANCTMRTTRMIWIGPPSRICRRATMSSASWR